MRGFEKYKVVYHFDGCEWLFGYADSIGEAVELSVQCEDCGMFINWIEKWDEASGRWVRAY